MKATKEQIKEAFRKTIERWERITKDIKYFDKTTCSLCLLENVPGDTGMQCNASCPIFNYKGEDHRCCRNTPYGNFYEGRDYESALVELSFLREVYLDFLENEIQGLLDEMGEGIKEEKKDSRWEVLTVEVKEEKKEEWIDITENLEFRPYRAGSFYWIGIYQKGNPVQIGWLDAGGADICTHEIDNYKVKKQGTGNGAWDNYFRILKKRGNEK